MSCITYYCPNNCGVFNFKPTICPNCKAELKPEWDEEGEKDE